MGIIANLLFSLYAVVINFKVKVVIKFETYYSKVVYKNRAF